MRKNSIITFSALVIVLTMGSCSKSDSLDYDNERIINFGASSTTGRAALEGTEFSDGSKFSVWGWRKLTDGESESVNVFNGIEVTKSGNSWKYDETRYWIPGYTYSFYGVYPAELKNVTVSSSGNIEVKSFDCSATGNAAIDLMTATSDPNFLSGDNPPEFVNLNFKHELAKVNFIVKSENNAVDITQFKVYNVIYKGSLNPTWGSYTKNEQKDEIYNSSSFNLNNNSKNVFGDVLIIPHDNENLKQANILISYKYSNEEDIKTKTLPLAINNVIDSWESGKSYNYSLTIKPNGITFSGLKADIWEETSSGGNIVIK